MILTVFFTASVVAQGLAATWPSCKISGKSPQGRLSGLKVAGETEEECAQECERRKADLKYDAAPGAGCSDWTFLKTNSVGNKCVLGPVAADRPCPVADDQYQANADTSFGCVGCTPPITDSSSTSSTSATSTTPKTSTTASNMDKFNKMPKDQQMQLCCEWAKKGQCDENPFFMRPSCPEACGTTGCKVNDALTCKVTVAANCAGSSTAASSTTAAPGSASAGGTNCNDVAGAQCPQWSSQSQCDSNPYYMKIQCAKSCSSCGTTAAMLDAERKDPNCPDADKNGSCGFWESTGECTKNVGWMRTNCASSCKACPTG